MLSITLALLIINLALLIFVIYNQRSQGIQLKKNAEQFDNEALLLRIQHQFDNHASQSNKLFLSELTNFKDKLYENQLKSQNDLHALLSTFEHQNQERTENSGHRLKVQLIESIGALQKQIQDSLVSHQKTLGQHFEQLNQTTETRLHQIGEKVETKLQQGFEKTSQTFTDIVKRLALIDDAQKKIHDLSSNVVSLQEILQDKRSRGAFGEIQLSHLLQNSLPPNGYALQYTLANQTRVDAMLFLPKPSGHISIDAKFPLESYKVLSDISLPSSERQKAQLQFKQDIKKHIQDISQKYIIPGETSDGAIMFIPAEAVFAEIHAHYPDLIESAYHHKVWLTSPTTMMAILTTASAVLKDSATKEQVHIIQKHLKDLSGDFNRFEKRMDNLAKHLQQANVDVEQVHTTAKKISGRFAKIEKVELDHLQAQKPSLTTEDDEL